MNDDRQEDRDRLLAAIDKDMRETAALTGRDSLAPAVRAALARVPRHRFVGAGDAAAAYANRPLSIGHGQTISQPYIVALMTDLLDLSADAKQSARLLDVGAGSGYQSAVLAELAREVYAIEVVAPLAAAAGKRLARLRYDNVTLKAGDGAAGWPEHAPYDGIIVAAAARRAPPALLAQLKPGAKLVIPLGSAGESQQLATLSRDKAGRVTKRNILPVAFVPFTGRES
jgi:protein-L-isoaspartate(D-aspartate) O-methyltransferase